MNKIVTLRSGQFLLLVLSLLAMGAAAGLLGAAIAWHVRQAFNPAILLELLGGAAFVVCGIWKSCDDWATRTSAVTRTSPQRPAAAAPAPRPSFRRRPR